VSEDWQRCVAWGDEMVDVFDLRQPPAPGERQKPSRQLQSYVGELGGVLPADPQANTLLGWSTKAFDGQLTVWNLTTKTTNLHGGEVVVEGHRSKVNGIVLMEGGKQALSWSRDETLRLWDMTQVAHTPGSSSPFAGDRDAAGLLHGRHHGGAAQRRAARRTHRQLGQR
jgi:WD40 repeat protein